MINNPSDCTALSGRNRSLLTLGLYLIPLGESSLRTCATALGADQFDEDNPAELPGKISFFNWFEISTSLGAMVGVVFLVWVQDNVGWDLGFALAALMVLVGTLGVAVGLPFYRHGGTRSPPEAPSRESFRYVHLFSSLPSRSGVKKKYRLDEILSWPAGFRGGV
jgi:dipeptide/tripeptide permease